MNLNWDFAEPALEWILTREDCHLATAVEMFWLSHDSDLLQYPNRGAAEAAYFDGAFDFTLGIVTRAMNGFYPNALISYNLQEDRVFQIKEYEEAEERYRTQGLPWIAPSFFRFRHQMLTIDAKSIRTGFWSITLSRLMEDLGTSWGIQE